MKNGVLLVGNFFSSLSGQSVCDELAKRLAALRWTVLTTSSRSGRLPRLVDMVWSASAQRDRYSVAHVDVYSGLAFVWAEAVCWVLRRARKPFVLTLHGGGLPAFARRWPARIRRLLGAAAAVTTPSRYLLEQMRPYRSDLCLLPNPLDLKAYTFMPRERPLRPSLIWLRAFHDFYNPTLAPKVLSLLVPDFPDIRLVMVGPDKGDGSFQRTQRLSEGLRIASRMSLPGGVPRSNVSHWLNQGDIFLNTAKVDNTPISVLEAMASGLCIVSTNVGGIPYLLEHDRDALLVAPDDPEAMAAAVRSILNEPGLAKRLSANARQKAEQFDWSIVLPQWEKLLSSFADRSRV